MLKKSKYGGNDMFLLFQISVHALLFIEGKVFTDFETNPQTFTQVENYPRLFQKCIYTSLLTKKSIGKWIIFVDFKELNKAFP